MLSQPILHINEKRLNAPVNNGWEPVGTEPNESVPPMPDRWAGGQSVKETINHLKGSLNGLRAPSASKVAASPSSRKEMSCSLESQIGRRD